MLNRIPKNLLSLLLALITYATSYAAIADPIDVDHLLKTANLPTLIGTTTVRNLIAQMSDANTFTSNVNEMNDFIAVGVDDANETIVTEFDSSQLKLKQMVYGSPLVGVADFPQTDLSNVSLQDGLQLAKTCMARYYPAITISDQIARVAIYKTINTQQVVYDYVFEKNANANTGTCQEVLYTPAIDDCEPGMAVRCHYNVTVPRVVLLPGSP